MVENPMLLDSLWETFKPTIENEPMSFYRCRFEIRTERLTENDEISVYNKIDTILYRDRWDYYTNANMDETLAEHLFIIEGRLSDSAIDDIYNLAREYDIDICD